MTNTKQQILDIAMNLIRIGNWAADGWDTKQKRILLFLEQTQQYVTAVEKMPYSSKFELTMNRFIPEFHTLYQQGLIKPENSDVWAEKMMTWGNILTHRASLLE